MQTLEENLLTFNQLCKLKREAMGLNLKEAQKSLNYTVYGKFERGEITPFNRNIQRMIKFYKITDDELKKCKLIGNNNKRIPVVKPEQPKEDLKIRDILFELNKTKKRIETMDLKGDIGKTIHEKISENIYLAQSSIQELLILDRIN